MAEAQTRMGPCCPHKVPGLLNALSWAALHCPTMLSHLQLTPRVRDVSRQAQTSGVTPPPGLL